MHRIDLGNELIDVVANFFFVPEKHVAPGHRDQPVGGYPSSHELPAGQFSRVVGRLE